MTDATDNSSQGGGGAKSRKLSIERILPFGVRMMLPALLLLAALSLLPFFFIIFMSFHEVSPIGGLSYEWVGFENWSKTFTDETIRQSWITSLIYFPTALILEMALGIGIALLVHELAWGKNIAISVIIMPVFMAPVIVGLLGRFLLDPTFGLYDWILRETGIFTGNVFGSGSTALTAIIFMDVWEWTPLITLIVVAGLAAVPHDIVEAAQIDGANYWQRLRYIIAPSISGIVVVALLIRSMDLIRYFDKILVTTNGGPANATKIIPIRLYEVAFRFFELGYGAAIGLTMLVFTIIVAISFLQILKRQGLVQ
jgi:multiple sugar transport system permease protein